MNTYISQTQTDPNVIADFTMRRSSGTRFGGRDVPRTIHYTDMVCATVVLNGVAVAQIKRDRISNFSALLAMLRAMAPASRGLGKLQVRNLTTGWSMVTPFMLYGEEPSLKLKACLQADRRRRMQPWQN